VPCSLAGNVLASGEYHATPSPDAKVMSDSRREGICAAWAAELLINGAVDHPRELLDMQHANGWRVDMEMAHHVGRYVEYCRQWGSPQLVAEAPVRLFDGLVRGRVDATGTGGEVLRIFDLKYGWQPVEVRENWAMLCYGLAFAQDGQAIELHIFQPRPHHPDGPARVWRIEAREVVSWLHWLRGVATAARDNPRASIGPHCDKCPAQVSCVANAKITYGLYEAMGERRMHGHTPEQLAAEAHFLTRAADVIADRRNAVLAEVEARIKAGKMIPGFALKPAEGNREFVAPPELLELATGVSPWKQVLKSPAEMEREGVPKHIMEVLTKKRPKGQRLTANPTAYAEKMFGKVTE